MVIKRPSKRRVEPIDRRTYLARLCRTVPYNLVEAVLEEPSEKVLPSAQYLEGTALVLELIGFGALCEDLAAAGPQSISRLTRGLNQLFARLLEDCLFPYRGYVLHFGSDRIFVFFQGDAHAAHAAAAAFDCHAAVRDLAGSLGRDLALRAGIACGPISIHLLGDLTQRHCTSGHRASHRAAALAREAGAHEILLDKECMKELGASVSVEPTEAPDIFRAVEMRQRIPRSPVVELGNRINRRTEEKIALLEPFLPAPLALRLQTTPAGWRVEGELREVVVLAAYSGGFDVDEIRQHPETLTQVSRTFLSVMRKYGGIPLRTEVVARGHVATVLFGLHRPQENDAERALLAALEAGARLKTMVASQRSPVQYRFGVTAGPIYFGAFGGEYRHDMTVVGRTVQRAHAVAEHARAFEVVAGPEVIDLIDHEFETSAREVQGEPFLAVHGSAKMQPHFVRPRRKPRFYAGRESAIDVFHNLVDRCLHDGKGAMVGMVGEPGTGKSALLSSFIDHWGHQGYVGLLGRCRYSHRTTPLAPITSIISTLVGISPSDDADQRADRLHRGLQAYRIDDGRAELLSLLAPTEGVAVDLGDSDSREKVLSAVLQLFEQHLEEGPVLYILEDLHLGDSLTLELATRLPPLIKDRQALCIGTYRPEPSVRHLRREVNPEIELLPLTRSATEALVAHELGADSVEASFLRFLLERTRGNPRYLIEILRFLDERGLLTVRGGIAVAPSDRRGFLEDVVPPSWAQMALARLDQLGDVERRLVRTASAIGSRFGRRLLQEAASAPIDGGVLEAAVANLVGEDLIIPEAGGSTDGWRFRDEVTRTVAYRGIQDDERRKVHQRIADALESLPPTEPGRSPATLAWHRERAGQLKDAAQWYEDAARLALRAGMPQEVRDLIGRWARIQERLRPEQRASIGTAAEMSLMRLIALGRQGVPGEAASEARRLQTRYMKQLPEDKHRVVDYWLGAALVDRGQPDLALLRLERLFQNAREPGLRCDAALHLARLAERRWDLTQAQRWLREADALTCGDLFRRFRLVILRARLHLGKGLEAATSELSQVEREAMALGHFRLEAEASWARGRHLLHWGRLAEAIEALQVTLERYRSLSAGNDLSGALVDLGQALAWAGRLEEARHQLEDALSVAEDVGAGAFAAVARVHLAWVQGQLKDPVAGEEALGAMAGELERLQWREPQAAAALHRVALARLRQDDEGPFVVKAAPLVDGWASPLYRAALRPEETEQAKPSPP